MPGHVAIALDQLCLGLPEARWVDTDDFHLTLRFIGEVESEIFFELGESLATIRMAPFDLELRGIGHFPPRGPIRQLWTGVAPNIALDRLRRSIDKCVVEAGVPRAARKFIPHVSIARFRQPPNVSRLASYLERHSLLRIAAFPIDSFCLYSSILRYRGAEHKVEAEYDFVRGIFTRI
jgi:2'-5' RNA ligase